MMVRPTLAVEMTFAKWGFWRGRSFFCFVILSGLVSDRVDAIVSGGAGNLKGFELVLHGSKNVFGERVFEIFDLSGHE